MKQVIMLLMLGLAGCSYTHMKGQNGLGSLGDVNSCGPVDFATINAKVFKKSCTGCHSDGSGEEVKGLFFDGYPTISGNIKASVKAVLDGKMPKNGRALSQEQVELLLAWQKQDTPEFTAEPSVQSCSETKPVQPDPIDPVKPDPVKPDPVDPERLEATYDSIRKFIFEKKCSGCHGINDTHPKPAKHNYNTYESIVQYVDLFTPMNEDSKFAQALITGDMPFNEDPLPDEEVAVIIEWIKAGLPKEKGGVPALLPDVINNMSAN